MNSENIKTPIEGVIIKPLKVNTDERGNFIEVLREDWKILDKMEQVSVSIAKPGIIKAFHLHLNQDEIFHVLEGKAHVVLYDTRKNSKTKGIGYEKVMEDNIDKEFLLVPRGVAHGYKIIGNKPLRMLYIANKQYNTENPDEHRIPQDDPEIGFDWDKMKQTRIS